MSAQKKGARVVLIAAGDSALPRQWREALKEGFAIHAAAELAALERRMNSLRPPILLLDLELPGLDGLEGVTALQDLYPLTKILLFSSFPTERGCVAALKAGVKSYCTKTISPCLLRKAVAAVQAG